MASVLCYTRNVQISWPKVQSYRVTVAWLCVIRQNWTVSTTTTTSEHLFVHCTYSLLVQLLQHFI